MRRISSSVVGDTGESVFGCPAEGDEAPSPCGDACGDLDGLGPIELGAASSVAAAASSRPMSSMASVVTACSAAFIAASVAFDSP